ncbi:MAG TPA: hypothetical protein VKA08_17310, partial [Balneolales bacterium]|nr:hypothetical protein [Balneolales bacterium]
MTKMLHLAAIRMIGICLLLLVVGLGVSHAQTAKQVTIRDLNSYTSLTSLDQIPNQQYTDSLVSFTAIISSYPKDSGLATYTESSNSISRINVFVTDTSAASMGRDGMSMQIVETDYNLIENLGRGTVVDVTGKLTFYYNTAQFDLVSITDITPDLLVGNVLPARYQNLLKPVDAQVKELNLANSDGTMQADLSNYQKYVNSYVKITNATVVNVSLGDRPNWALKQGDNLIYIYDTSLRYRNDRSTYRTGYNFRHTQDGTFEPPPPGAIVNLSGYITMSGDNPDGLNASGQESFSINPFDDGIVWLNDVKHENGIDGFEWPNDLEIVGYPPSFANYTISDHTPTSTDQVHLSVDVTPNNGANLVSVKLIYIHGTDTTSVDMQHGAGDAYTYDFPTFANYSTVSFHIEATDDNGLVGMYPQGSNDSFIVLDQEVNTISLIQKTPDGKPGDSPLAGLGTLPMNITAWVVADSADGFIAIQDAKDPWSGIFLNADSGGVKSLKRGDKITITQGSVFENYNVTYLNVSKMTTISSGNDISGLIPDLLTQDITNTEARGEPYEGMLIRFNDVKITTNQADYPSDYGEFEIGSRQGGGVVDTISTYQGLRIDDGTNDHGTVAQLTADLNENIRIGSQFQSVTGAMWYSFGNFKLIIRSLSDFVSTQWTSPVRVIKLLNPTNGSDVTVDHNLTVQWGTSKDYDGNKVHYIWALTTPKDTAFKNTLAMMNSDNSGQDPQLSLPYKTVDNLLSAAGLKVGESTDLIWTVFMTDGFDTVQTSTYTAPDFTSVYSKV